MTEAILRTTPALAAAAISTVTDLRGGYIYDRVLLPAGLAVTIGALAGREVYSAALGAAAGGATLFLLWLLTSRRGIGLGDVKLAAVLGAGTTWVGALEMLGAAFVLGGCVAITLLASGRKRGSDAIAFAPFLTAGFLVSLLWGLAV